MSSFKPGNWVRHIAFKSKHKCISINDGEFDNKVSVTNSPSFDNEFMIDYELWQPKVGEWCWFWSKSFPKPQLLPFRSYFRNDFYSTEYGVTIFNEVLCKCNYFDYCEPFIGQLPTNLKDQS